MIFVLLISSLFATFNDDNSQDPSHKIHSPGRKVYFHPVCVNILEYGKFIQSEPDYVAFYENPSCSFSPVIWGAYNVAATAATKPGVYGLYSDDRGLFYLTGKKIALQLVATNGEQTLEFDNGISIKLSAEYKRKEPVKQIVFEIFDKDIPENFFKE